MNMNDDVKIALTWAIACTLMVFFACVATVATHDDPDPRAHCRAKCRHVEAPAEEPQVKNCHPGIPTTVHDKTGTHYWPSEECELVNP